MVLSHRKFVFSFLLFGFVFLFVTTTLLGSTGPRGFPQSPDSLPYTGSDSSVEWKKVVSTTVFPVKVILVGPLALPQVHFLQDDPPPPLIGLFFVLYWTILASVLSFILGKARVIVRK